MKHNLHSRKTAELWAIKEKRTLDAEPMTQTRYDHCPTCGKNCVDVEAVWRPYRPASFHCTGCGAKWRIDFVPGDHIIIKRGVETAPCPMCGIELDIAATGPGCGDCLSEQEQLLRALAMEEDRRNLS